MNPTNQKPLFLFIAEAVTASQDCEARGNAFGAVWRDRLEQAARVALPSGSGFDAGTRIDLDASRPDRITFKTAFHHMDSAGVYTGWTQHKIIMTPAFGSPALRVTGKNRNGIKDHIAETVGAALEARVGYIPDGREPGAFRVVSAPGIDRETLETNAACLWEAVLEAYRESGRAVSPAWVQHMRDHWEGNGVCRVREAVCALAGDVDSGWKIARACGFDSPFDWEFCPWFIAACVDWEQGPTLVPDWRDRCRAMGDADRVKGGAAANALDALNHGGPV